MNEKLKKLLDTSYPIEFLAPQYRYMVPSSNTPIPVMLTVYTQ